MPFIWNDPTFWDRLKSERKYRRFFLLIISLFMVATNLLLSDEIFWQRKTMFGFLLAITIWSIIQLLFKLPNAQIPDTYHPATQIAMRVFFVFLGTAVSLIFWLKMIVPLYGSE